MVKRTKHGRQVDDLQNSIDLVGKYTAAMNTRESAIMDRLRSPDFELDFVYGDVFQTQPLSGEGTERFWPTWFNAFPDGEFEPTRTIAGEQVIVVQWTFSGTHKQTLGEPIMTPDLPATNRISVWCVSPALRDGFSGGTVLCEFCPIDTRYNIYK